MSIEQPGILDAVAHDTRTDCLVLAMYESRPWEGDQKQLFQLQEKLNAYVSFLLDGELKEAFPALADKQVEIHLRTLHDLDEKAIGFVKRVSDQLDLQGIRFEVIQIDEAELGQVSGGGGGGCGGTGQCSCGHG